MSFFSFFFSLAHADKFADVLGESIRSDILDGQVGVPLHIDFRIYDANTCKPIKGTYFEI